MGKKNALPMFLLPVASLPLAASCLRAASHRPSTRGMRATTYEIGTLVIRASSFIRHWVFRHS